MRVQDFNRMINFQLEVCNILLKNTTSHGQNIHIPASHGQNIHIPASTLMDKKRQMKRGIAELEKTCGNYKSTIIKTYV